jgi:hypothetical protein
MPRTRRLDLLAPKGARQFVRSRIQEFRRLEQEAEAALAAKLEWQDFETLRRCLRGRSRTLAKRELRVQQTLIAWAYLSLALMLLAGTYLLVFLLGTSAPKAIGVLAGMASFASLVLVIVVVPPIRKAMQWRASVFKVGIVALTSLLIIIWAIGGSYTSAKVFPRYLASTESTRIVIAASVAAGVAASLMALITFFLSAVAFNTIRRFLFQRSAEAIVAIRLARVIAWLQGNDTEYRDHAIRRQMSTHLEAAAGTVEHSFPRFLWLPANSSNTTLRHHFRSVSHHMREYQLWVMVPSPRSRKDLLQELTRMYGAIALREMDLLPATPTLQLDRPHQLRLALSTVWKLLAGFLPLGIVLILQWRGFKLPSPLDTGAISVAALWAFASVMMLIDPLFSTRLATVKDITQAFRGVGGGTGKNA